MKTPKTKKAKWLIESLRYRDEILAKIGIAIYTLQKEFLRRGFKSLRPMNLSILSEKLVYQNQQYQEQ